LAHVFDNATNAQYAKLPTNQFAVWEAETHRQRQEVAGKFNDTLFACQQLLQQNEFYLSKKENVWDNAKWLIAGANDRSERLRTKLKSQAEKVRLKFIISKFYLPRITNTCRLIFC
jgi:hypothetical protein